MIVMQPVPKGNSFTRGLSKQQLFTYSSFALIASLFYLGWGLQTYSRQDLPLIMVFTLALLLLLGSAFASSVIDPTDPSIQQYYAGISITPSEQTFFCQICMSLVGRSSKHCLVCARCVSGFDHHCRWINNCIGGANYRWFMAMVGSAFCVTACYVVQAVLMIERTEVPLGARACVWVVGGLAAVLGLLDLNLLAFHLYLLVRGMTTYEWILRGRERQEERTMPKQDINEDTLNILQ